MIVASMATLPARRAIALRAVASILPQVDGINIWLDKHTADEATEADEAFGRLFIELGRSDDSTICIESGDRGDGGKFFPLRHLRDDDVWLILDDDLELPPDYAVAMAEALRAAENRSYLSWGGRDGAEYCKDAVVGLHALRLPERCTSYRRQRERVQHCLRYGTRPVHRHGELVRAHVLGTSSVVTRPRYLRGFESVDVTSPPNVGDLHLAAWCERQGIPRYCLPLPRERWLTNLLPGDAPSIWDGDASGGRDVQVANEDAVVSSVEWRPL